MATIKEIIERVDETKLNDFSEKIKLRWISLLDGKVAASVYLLDIAEAQKQAYAYPDDLEKEPLIEFPYDDLYDLWLEAKIDFENGEYNKYQNTMEMFNSHYNDFVRWLADTYEPSQGTGCTISSNRYFISAYGLAVKHGFTGTEEEYVRSLIGEDGASLVLRYEGNVIQWRQEDDAQWIDLLDMADIQGAVIAQTMDTATAAARDAVNARSAIQDMKVSAETLAPGSNANVRKTETGGALELHFGIPQGAVGPQGEAGPQGPQGVQGPQGERGINGVAVEATGFISFNVTEDGILQCIYSGDEAPDLSINADGHLILEL